MAADGKAVELDINEWSRIVLALCGSGGNEVSVHRHLLKIGTRIANQLAEALDIDAAHTSASDCTDSLQEQLMDMQTIVDDWKANAEQHSDGNFDFLHSLKMESIGRWIGWPTACTKRRSGSSTAPNVPTVQNDFPVVRNRILRRIAEHLGMKATDSTTQYLKADDDGDLYLKAVPVRSWELTTIARSRCSA